MSEELLPCPFCGAQSLLETGWTTSINGPIKTFFAVCENCQIRTPIKSSYDDVISIWNARHEPKTKTNNNQCDMQDFKESIESLVKSVNEKLSSKNESARYGVGPCYGGEK